MTKKQFIGELAAGDTVEDIFLIASAQQNQARNGPYWRVELRDASGTLEAKIWSPLSQQFQDLKSGSLVELNGRITVYRERNEIAVDAMRILEPEEIERLDLSLFITASRQNAAEMLEELEVLCRKYFTHVSWKKFYRQLLKDDDILQKLAMAPAAKAMHHAYAGGLLEHTLAVCRLSMVFADLYPQLDRQVLLAGAICHDLGKLWELSSGLAVDYTSTGRLIGHISICLEKIEPFIRKSSLEPELAEHLKHLILSHHGTREFGSPCLPSTAEAMALHYADNLDAKLNQVQGALSGIDEAETGWSNYVPGLDRMLYKAQPTPASENSKIVASKTKTNQESQCSLLSKE